MANKVYDPEIEKPKKKDSAPGSHDDLGVHPERREAETEELEKLYNSDSAPEPSEMEKSYAKDEKEWSDLQDQIGSRLSGEDDEAGGGLYKPKGDDKKGLFKGKGSGGGIFKKRGAKLALGGGALGIMLGVFGLFGFLNTFRMDNFNKNVDLHVYKRLSASLDARNKYLVRSYIKMRVMEAEGGTRGETTFFKASKVESDHPLSDWYRTLRKNNFEEEVFNKEGVFFTAMVDKDGNILPSKITLKDDNLDFDLQAKYKDVDFDAILKGDQSAFVDMLNKLDDDDLDKVATVEGYKTHKTARREAKAVVNRNIPWWKTVKRRHLRKDISNVVGIKQWRLFEKSRDKVAKKRAAVESKLIAKIVEKFYGNNPSVEILLKCIFTQEKCVPSSDPENPDLHSGTATTGKGLPEDSTDAKGEDGKDPLDSTLSPGNEGAAAIDEGLEKAAEETIEGLDDNGVRRLERASVSRKIIFAIIAKVSGRSFSEVVNDAAPIPDPTKLWRWAKRLTFIHNIIGKNGEGESALTKMIYNARRAQMVGLYSAYAMGSDQIKSGELVGDELNAFFATTNNIGNSEGWAVLSGQAKPEDYDNSADKKNYCEKAQEADNDIKSTDFAYYCDDIKPNGGSNAKDVTDGYNSSVGPIVSPIAAAVNAVEETFVGKIADFVSELGEKIFDALGADDLINNIMKNTEFGKSLANVMGNLMEQLLAWLGAAPMFDGTQPTIGNLLVAGASAQNESSIRASGGFIPDKKTMIESDKLASEYQATQDSKRSTYDRYLSLDDGRSLASTSLFAISNISATNLINRVGAMFSSAPRVLATVFSGKTFAQTNNTDFTKWAGVDRYDIPQKCIDRDPLDKGIYEWTNYDEVTGKKNLDWDTVRNNDKFYAKVYEWVAEGSGDEAEKKRLEAAEKIWDCHILDARAMGGLGALYGYNKDAGYDSGGDSATTAEPATSASTAANATIVGEYAFPLLTTKSGIGNPGMFHDGTASQGGHPYIAYDILTAQGTPVASFLSGVVKKVGTDKCGGTSIGIYNEPSDLIISYLHLGPENHVSVGDTIKVGQQVALVGSAANGCGTIHLHIDAAKGQVRPACKREDCPVENQALFVDIGPKLYETFQALPD